MEEIWNIDDEKVEVKSCRLKLNSKLNKRAPLFITEFTNGRLKVSDRNKVKFNCFKSTNNLEKFDADRNLTATNNHMNYSGVSIKNTNAIRYFVGVRNNQTGKMKLYDSSIFRMKPDVGKIIADLQKQKDSEESKITITPKTYREGMDDLTENFGSKLKKRALNARLKHSVDASLEDVVNLDNLKIDSFSKSPIQTVHAIDYLPNINRNASAVTDVFDVNEVISYEEDLALNDQAATLIEDSSDKSKFCSYVSTHLELLLGFIDLERTKYLIYYNYLVSFQKLGYKEMQRKDFSPDIPQPFKQKMIDNFVVLSKTATGKVTRTFPPQKKDKLLSHILLLALFIDDYSVNTIDVLADLKSVTTTKLITIAQALGCHIKPQKIKDNTVKFVELKLPLFVCMRNGMRKSS